MATYGGIRVDSEGRVIDVYGEIIPKLYAAGEITGGFHGEGYMSGSALGKALVFGRIVGRNAYAEKSLKS
jgi:fumarate reductase flavoprotein subunit